jgi:sn-glycerol 3-phosphate transport system ATP-binding protein
MSMADQIVLLDQGAIVQIGSPAEIYTKPKSVFSARFVGVPPMNILDMNKVSGVDFSIKSPEKPNVKTEVQYIGVRPEHISISKRGLPVTVFGMDYFGGETVVRVHYHDNIIYMRCANQPDIKTGDELKVAWPDTQVHIFDKNKVRIPSG